MESASAPHTRRPPSLLLPDELLSLLFSLLDAQTACCLSQTSRSWQLWVAQNKPECHFAWLHQRALLLWTERAQMRVKSRSQHMRGLSEVLLSSFTPPTACCSSSVLVRLNACSQISDHELELVALLLRHRQPGMQRTRTSDPGSPESGRAELWSSVIVRFT